MGVLLGSGNHAMVYYKIRHSELKMHGKFE